MLCKPPSYKGFRELKEACLKCHSPKTKQSQARRTWQSLKAKVLDPQNEIFHVEFFSSVKNAMNLQNYFNNFF